MVPLIIAGAAVVAVLLRRNEALLGHVLCG